MSITNRNDPVYQNEVIYVNPVPISHINGSLQGDYLVHPAVSMENLERKKVAEKYFNTVKDKLYK